MDADTFLALDWRPVLSLMARRTVDQDLYHKRLNAFNASWNTVRDRLTREPLPQAGTVAYKSLTVEDRIAILQQENKSLRQVTR